jgi:hypothetical protein
LIGIDAFRDPFLAEIGIPASVEQIEIRAFFGCLALVRVEFVSDSHLVDLGPFAFAKCDKLTKITLPSSLEKLGESAFPDCTKLAECTFEAGSKLRSIGPHLFSDCSALVAIVLPPNIDFIPDNCFENCSSLTTVAFEPDSQLRRNGSKGRYEREMDAESGLVNDARARFPVPYESCLKSEMALGVNGERGP